MDCMARGCRYLATIWQGAWKEGIKAGGKIADLTKSSHAALIALYRKPTELPSKHLDTIDAILKKKSAAPKPIVAGHKVTKKRHKTPV